MKENVIQPLLVVLTTQNTNVWMTRVAVNVAIGRKEDVVREDVLGANNFTSDNVPPQDAMLKRNA
jgi:hypothetical protein